MSKIPWNRIKQDVLKGATQTEVAEKYDVSVNTVKSYIRRNKLTEKRALAEETGNLVSLLDKVNTGKTNGKELAVLEKSVENIQNIAPALISEDTRVTATRHCEKCTISNVCSHFEEGSHCKISQPIKSDTSEDLIHIVQTMISVETDRILQAIYEEKRSGAIGFNLDVSEAIFNLMKVIKIVRDMSNNHDEIFIKASGPGILQKIFGSRE